MASQPVLDSLPLEITTSIVSYLETEDCRNLRLVGRRLAQQLYPDMPTEKTLNAASESDLRLFTAMTESGQPGCAIVSLTLIEKLGEHDEPVFTVLNETGKRIALDEGFSSDSDFEPPEGLDIRASSALLAQAFRNLGQHSASKALRKLILRTTDARPALEDYNIMYHSFHHTKTAGHLHQRALLALHSSQLPVMAVHITGHHLRSVSPSLRDLEAGQFVLALDGIAAIINKIDLAPSLRSLKELSITFAPSPHTATEKPSKGTASALHKPKEERTREFSPVSSICDLLKFCPNLENLHLKGYDAWRLFEQSLLQKIVDQCNLASLRTCCLEGFGTKKGELLSFLRHHSQLQSLTIKSLRETEDQFAEIFSHIALHMPELQFLHLDNLWERTASDGGYKHNLVWFEGDGNGHFPHTRMRGPNEIKREGEAVRELLVRQEYRGGRALGSPYSMRWSNKLVRDYGTYPSW